MIWYNHLLTKVLWATIVLLSSLAWSDPVNPEVGMLRHGEFELQGTLVTNQRTLDDKLQREWPFVSSLEFGVLDRSVIGVQYGEGVSLSGKTLIFEQEAWVPSMTLGFRHLFSSQEAHIFQVADSSRSQWENDIYLQFYRILESGTQIQAGINILSSLGEGGASPFWGIQWRTLPHLAIDYNGFQRNSLAHHNLGISYVQDQRFEISLGLSEVQEWLYQEGQLGFYQSPERVREDAIFSPGVYLQISMRGLISNAQRGTTQLRLKDLEERQSRLSDSLTYLKNRLARTEILLSEITGPRVVFDEEDETHAALILDQLVKTYRATPDEVKLLRQLQDSLLIIGEASHKVLTKLVEHPATDDLYRETVIKVIGNTKLKKFSGSLLPQLKHPKVIIRREALIALGKISDLSTLDEVKKLLKDKDPIVQIIAQQVVDNIIAKAKQIEESQGAAPSESGASQGDESQTPAKTPATQPKALPQPTEPAKTVKPAQPVNPGIQAPELQETP